MARSCRIDAEAGVRQHSGGMIERLCRAALRRGYTFGPAIGRKRSWKAVSARSFVLLGICARCRGREDVRVVKVNTKKSVRPSAKATSLCGELNSSGCRPSTELTIFTVIVVIGSSGLRVRLAATPAASTTIIVSPMARDAVSRCADDARQCAGSIAPQIVSRHGAPRPSEPSRRDCGTACDDAVREEDTNGMSITPMTKPAVKIDCAWINGEPTWPVPAFLKIAQERPVKRR